jgi:XRE family transcriptional regulator, aerobic/anaerobic benzoate catabolism transcriptional regulator
MVSSYKTPPANARESAVADVSAVAEEGEFLRIVGQHVRDARARHGMTRRMLAHDSGLSERYLAQLEAGEGNLSIVLLRRVAAAIDISLARLVSEDEPAAESELIIERLRHLDEAGLTEVSRLLQLRFGLGNARTERVALIGMRGAGKTTLGGLAARRLNWDFVELSDEVEREACMTLAEIFDAEGQAAYRRYERRAIQRVVRTRMRVVIAAGGGLVAEAASFERLLASCYTIWLSATPEEHWERVVRAEGDLRVTGGESDDQAMADLRRILVQRERFYRKADTRLDTTGKTTEAALVELLGLVRHGLNKPVDD